MDISIDSFDEQLYKVRFCLHQEDIKNAFDSLGFQSLQTEFQKESFYHFLEENLIINAIIDREIIPLKTKKFVYYNRYRRAMPITGIVFFTKLPELLEFSIPREIPSYVTQQIAKKEKTIANNYDDCLIKLGLYDVVESNVVTETSTVYYNITKLNDSNETETIKDLTINMKDNNSLCNELINARLEDRIFTEIDNQNVEICITKILDKVLYTDDSCDMSKLKKIGYRKMSKLKEDYIEAETIKNRIDEYLNYLSNFLYEKDEIKFTPKVFEFYKSVYSNQETLLSDREITLKILLDFIQRAIEMKISDTDSNIISDQSFMSYGIMNNPLYFYVRTDLMKGFEIFDYFVYLLILTFYKDNNIIKGLDF